MIGSGLAAGALGGAILGHVLTPTQTKVIEQAPSSSSSGSSSSGSNDSGGDRIIIINNGQPMNVSEFNGTTTVINPAGQATNAAATVATTNTPLAPMAGETDSNATSTDTSSSVAAASTPAPGGIICVPTRLNETDPNDPTKMVEVEKIACYPAPPPPPQAPPAGAQIDPTVSPAAGPEAGGGAASSLTSNQANMSPIPMATNEKLSDGQMPLKSSAQGNGMFGCGLLIVTALSGVSHWLLL